MLNRMRDLNRLDLEMSIASRLWLRVRPTIRFPLPARLEQLAHLEAREGMCFGVEDDVREGEQVVGGEEEVEVFEGFGLEGVSI